MKTTRLNVRKNGAAFTLLELLACIACIAILAALLVPGFRSMRDMSNTMKSISNLKQIGAALHLYINDNRGMLPRADGGETDQGEDWTVALRPYGASFRRPEPRMDQNPLMLNPAGVSAEYGPGSIKSSYCMNGNLQVNSVPPAGQSIAPVYPIALAKVPKPSQTVVFADSMYAARAMNYSHLAYRCGNKTKATMVFVDGHAEARTKDAVSYEANFENPPSK